LELLLEQTFDIDQHKKLSKICKQSGVPIAEQVRRAIAEWLAKNDIS
jgi:hypothetical protein